MKKTKICVVILICCLFLSGCSCEHGWQTATCTEPKTCSKCKETVGAPLGHTWKDATCTEAKTCEVCLETEGDSLGHTWNAATCQTPKTCMVCGATEGTAAGHEYTTEKCIYCGKPMPFSPENYGFQTNFGMTKLVQISSYSIGKETSTVTFRFTGKQQFIYDIKDNVIYDHSGFVNDKKDTALIGSWTYDVVNNDCLQNNEGGIMTIFDRVTDSYDHLIIKVMRGQRELWFVLSDQIDWDVPVKIKKVENRFNTLDYTYTLK